MPYVNIKITNENVTKEKKVKLIEGVTQLLMDVLDKNPPTRSRLPPPTTRKGYKLVEIEWHTKTKTVIVDAEITNRGHLIERREL